MTYQEKKQNLKRKHAILDILKDSELGWKFREELEIELKHL